MINPSVGTGKNLVTTRVLITERLSANTSNITRYKVRRQLIYKQDFERKFAKRLAYSSTSADMRRIHAFFSAAEYSTVRQSRSVSAMSSVSQVYRRQW